MVVFPGGLGGNSKVGAEPTQTFQPNSLSVLAFLIQLALLQPGLEISGSLGDQ